MKKDDKQIDVEHGRITIGDMVIFPGFTFEDFKKTKFYSGETPEEEIIISEDKLIDGRKYVFSIVFRNEYIYYLCLVNTDYEFSQKDNPKRKHIHDKILAEYGIYGDKKRFYWGGIKSDYDSRDNVSGIYFFFDSKALF